MADPPSGIDLARHRDMEGRKFGDWLRHGFLVLLTAFAIAALANVFGQRSTSSLARSSRASLAVDAPERIRGGLLYQAIFRIHAIDEIKAPVLVLDDGWIVQTTVNAVTPEPEGATSDAGHLKLRYGSLSAGQTLNVYLVLQANPTNVGSHTTGTALYDGSRRLVFVDRTQLNLP